MARRLPSTGLATWSMRSRSPAGRVVQAGSRMPSCASASPAIFLGDEHVNYEDIHAPPRIGGTPVYLDIETDDVAGLFDRAIAAGASEIRPPTDPSMAVQSAKVRDPFGHIWLITRSERSGG